MIQAADHFLITRFNLPSGGAESRIRAQETWLRNRVALFDRYCLPSVRAQDTTAFTWLVYFDPESPRWLRDLLEEHAAQGFYTPMFREEITNDSLLEDLQAHRSPGSTHVVTTKIDNDDGVATDFVSRLREAATEDGPRALYIGDGLILRDRRLYTRLDEHNAFPTVCARWEDRTTCWANWHNLLPRDMPATVLRGEPGWLQVIHGANVSNRVRGVLASPEEHVAHFPVLEGLVATPTRRDLMVDRLVAHPVREARDRLRDAGKSILMRTGGKDRLASANALVQRGRSQLSARIRP